MSDKPDALRNNFIGITATLREERFDANSPVVCKVVERVTEGFKSLHEFAIALALFATSGNRRSLPNRQEFM
jgi:hypothetical protein